MSNHAIDLNGAKILIVDDLPDNLRVLRQALEKHYADLCTFAQKLDSHITGDTDSLSTIKNADRIIVLDNGKLKEIGTHEELLSLNGIYSQIYMTQFAP